MLAATIVHTTGVNLEGTASIVASLTVIFGAMGALIVKSIKRSITDNTQEVVERVVREEVIPRFDEIHTEISKLKDTSTGYGIAISRLQGIQEGKRQVVAEANITTRDT